MFELKIDVQIRSDIERVFNAISDHAAFFAGPGIHCEIVEEGETEKNGQGAVRRISNKGVLGIERITSFERPYSFEYRVESFSWLGIDARMSHERGALSFEQQQGGTRLVWLSRFSVDIPIIGSVLEQIGGRISKWEFTRLLDRVKRELEAASQVI